MIKLVSHTHNKDNIAKGLSTPKIVVQDIFLISRGCKSIGFDKNEVKSRGEYIELLPQSKTGR